MDRPIVDVFIEYINKLEKVRIAMHCNLSLLLPDVVAVFLYYKTYTKFEVDQSIAS